MNRDAIARLLPEVVYRTHRPGTPLDALLAVMADMQDPIERTLEQLDAVLDPRRAGEDFVPWLARWVDLERILAAPADPAMPAVLTLPSGHGRLRELVAAACHLARHRGTASGLVTYLETATGVSGFAIEDGSGDTATARPFHFVVRAPAAARELESLVHTIIAMEKPAHATCEVVFAGDPGGDR